MYRFETMKGAQFFCIFSWESRYEWTQNQSHKEREREKKIQFPDNFVDLLSIAVVFESILDSLDYIAAAADDDDDDDDEEQ